MSRLSMFSQWKRAAELQRSAAGFRGEMTPARVSNHLGISEKMARGIIEYDGTLAERVRRYFGFGVER